MRLQTYGESKGVFFIVMAGKRKDLTGQKFGRLLVVSFDECKSRYGVSYYLCKCDCGNTKSIRGNLLKNGSIQSCTCLQKERTSQASITHGDSASKLYRVWYGIKSRCYNRNSSAYKWYGERGIKICDEWMKYENFKSWSITNGYRIGLTIDRINVNGNYEPNNCRWATVKEQCNNMRKNITITHNGFTLTPPQWSELIGINPQILRWRKSHGWSDEKIITTPINTKNQHGRKRLD